MPEALCQVLAHSKHSINVSCYYYSACHSVSELGAHSSLASARREPRSREGSELLRPHGEGVAGFGESTFTPLSLSTDPPSQASGHQVLSSDI